MDDVEITEMEEFDASRVDAVVSPANGMPFLVLKQLAPTDVAKADDTVDCETCDGKGTILEGNRDCPDCGATGKVAKAQESTATQNDLPDSDFAYIESGGEKDDDGKTTPRSLRHFPIHDEAHVRNALADADALRSIATQLADLADRLNECAGREQVELQAGAEDDPGDFFELSDAADMLGAALGTVARMAFTEAQEATSGDGDVAKAGKRLSTASVDRIKAARDHLAAAGEHLTGLLGEEQQKSDVADGGDTNDDKESEVTKEELNAALDERFDALKQQLADGTKPEAGDTTTEPAAKAEGSEEAKDDEAKPDVAKSEDATASPEGAAQQAPVEKGTDITEVLKSTVEEAVKAAVAPLEERLKAVEEQPMPGGPALNGVTKSGQVAIRAGQDDGTETGDVLKEFNDPTTSSVRKQELADEMSRANLTALYAGQPAPFPQ